MKTFRLPSALLLFLLSCGTVWSQSQQSGVAFRYNGKNPRTTLPGVLVQCDDASNNNVLTASNGSFKLSFPSLKAGDPLHNVRVSKKGMVVMNREAIAEWSVRKEPLVVVLRDAEELQKETRRMEQVTREASSRIYATKKDELENELAAGLISKKERAERLASLQAAVEAFRKQSMAYSTFLVGIDLREVAPVIQEAIGMVNEGKPEAAAFLLEEEDYPAQIRRGAPAYNTVLGSRVLLAIYRLCLEWKKYESLLEDLAAATDRPEVHIEYGAFLTEKGIYPRGIEQIEQALVSLDKTARPAWYLMGMNWLSNAYDVSGNPQKAIGICDEALSYMDSIGEDAVEEGFFLMGRASFLVIESTAMLGLGMDNDDIARKSLTAARRASRSEYASEGASLLITALSSRLLSLATQGRKEEFQAVAKELDELLNQPPETYSVTANTLTARLLAVAGDPEKREKTLRENIDICWNLSKDTPWKYEPLAAQFEQVLATDIIARSPARQRIPEVEELLDESIDILRRYSEISPDLHTVNLALSLTTLSSYFRKAGKVDEGVLADARAAVDLTRPYAEKDPAKHGPQMARSLSNYASCLERAIDKDHPDKTMVKESISSQEEALNILRQLPSLTTAQENEFIMMLISLATSYKQYLGKTRESNALLKEAESRAEVLAQKAPAVFGTYPELIKKLKLGLLLIKKGNIKLEE